MAERPESHPVLLGRGRGRETTADSGGSFSGVVTKIFTPGEKAERLSAVKNTQYKNHFHHQKGAASESPRKHALGTQSPSEQLKD